MLKNLNVPIEIWDLWLLDKLSSYLDLESSKLWEAEQSTKDRRWIEGTSLDSFGSHIVDRFLTFSEFVDFLEKRSQTLSMVRMLDNNLSRKRSLPSTSNYHHKRGFHVAPRETCILCDQQHSLLVCPEYANKTVEERHAKIRARNLCFNCLGPYHSQECTSSYRCKTCERKHHSSLHTLPALKSNNISQ
jgi:hypothetical protein